MNLMVMKLLIVNHASAVCNARLNNILANIIWLYGDIHFKAVKCLYEMCMLNVNYVNEIFI